MTPDPSTSGTATEARLRDEYQRFYDFVAGQDPAIVDAWHFIQNAALASPPPAPEPDEYLCPNCVTPWKCNGPHIPQGEATQVDESGSSEPSTESAPSLWEWMLRHQDHRLAFIGPGGPDYAVGYSGQAPELLCETCNVATADADEAWWGVPKGERASAQAEAPGLDVVEALRAAEFALNIAVAAESDDRSWYDEACDALETVRAALAATDATAPDAEREE